MTKVFETYRPEGSSTVNPYLFAINPEGLIQFLKNAFYAEELNRSLDERTGEISNCIVKIGESCFMVSQVRGEFLDMRTAFYLLVEDVDQVYKNAIQHGSENCFKPANMDYQDRQAGVIDPAGNYWWISKRLEQKAYED